MAAIRGEPSFKLDDIVHFMARMVGAEKSREVVLGATTLLGISSGSHLSADDARRLLDTLANVPGLVGAAARSTRKRYGLGNDTGEIATTQSTGSMRAVDPSGAPASTPASGPSTARSRTMAPDSAQPGSEQRRAHQATSPGSPASGPVSSKAVSVGGAGEPAPKRAEWTPTSSVQPSASSGKTLSSETGFDMRRTGNHEQVAEPAPRSEPAPRRYDAAVDSTPRRSDRSPGKPADPPSSKQRLPRSELVALLAHSLGRERSDELILAAARKLNIDAAAFNRDEALKILADLAAVPGVVGVTAKFAKARCVLRFPV